MKKKDIFNPKKASQVKLTLDQKIFFCSTLSYCLRSGIALSRALNIILGFEDLDKRLKLVARLVTLDLNEGKSLSFAMGKVSRTFDKAFIALVEAAEQTGQLDAVFDAIVKDYRREKKLASEIKQALAYPSIVISAMTVIAFMMVVVVIPKVADMYSRMQLDMPIYTAIILNSSVFINEHVWAVLGGMAGFIIINVLIIAKVPQVKVFFKLVISKMPVVKGLFVNYDLARFCRSEALLYANGVPILNSMEIATSVFFRVQFRKAMAAVKEGVKKGVSIKASFEQTGAFPSFFVQLIGVGEETASLEQAFENLSAYFDEKVTESVNRIASMIEPLLMVFLGVMVGGMIFSIITPVYQMVGGLV